ncbi:MULTISPECIES: sugar kinase [Clostridium]|jgi:2-dehydro-3-deoxygluconokinase|uniref:2-dehydro-3-deoxygluconokinase KdgK n=2 Tax=Clostridium TaxID=1485 RepID=M1MHR6_9CLOT|nr:MULTISPECIES: sugar kinase [Clostridium]AGF54456.1 2-dehydro-3-deoxygluconokinase KdgK [Clostridium saccharoperbutylacetonicum N1-4(HMT)]NRT59024.1 2-dehydro-3-deoxygluconokinase [Clostridium saccharoperbutylacetonicum]NSB28212.1 2-dehydro-3-deoxygluconokinase [Clostridium saccharoperbutylacetonicum]NSB41700.1 2-dehydro-3-deoxygluconokinase [Clostridium saccharoperbutylacetonicum]
MDVITIGDAMIAMCPSKKGPIMFCDTFERKLGGAELNVAIGCARLGIQSGWISRLGNDDFGKYILKTVRGEGADISEVKLVDGYPTSVYFREVLADGSSRSFYYREKSPTSTMKCEDLNEEYIKQAKVLHITGVFPSITKNNQAIILEAVKLAKKHNVLVSFDPNIRLKMWTKEEAKAYIEKLLPDVDIILIGDEEIEILLGDISMEAAIKTFHDYGIGKVIVKKGAKGALGSDGKNIYEVDAIKPKALVDTVGAGDGFAAGFLTSLVQGKTLEECVKFANAVGSLVVGVEGDNEGLPYYEDVLVHMGQSKKIER